MSNAGRFITLVVDLMNGARHFIRIEESLLRVRNEFEVAVEQQRKGNLPQGRIVDVRRERSQR